MVINDFVSAMQSKDHEALAACFAEECRLFDYCPSVVKRQNSFLFGRNAIEMYYHNKFMFGGFGMLDPRVVNERTVNFYADYNGTIIHALAQIENCTAEVKLYGMTDDLTSQLATGLSVKVYGKDPETLTTVSEKVMGKCIYYLLD